MLNFSNQVRSRLNRFSAGQSGLAAIALLAALAAPAHADVPLTRADVESVLNRVEFLPRGQSPRAARLSDFLAVGDALRTAVASRAELRFNDGSLARVGERSTFHFVPNTRNFRLSDGTVLLLIPPGRGRTTIQTPSAVTGIQGSALLVRDVRSRNLTTIIALTNNVAGPMTITTEAGTQEYPLYAGQMALIQNGKVQVVEVDLQMLYETSPLLQDLDLDNPDQSGTLDRDLLPVKEEALQALAQQKPFDADSTMVINPDLLSVTSTLAGTEDQPWVLSPQPSSSTATVMSPIQSVPSEGSITVSNLNGLGGQEGLSPASLAPSAPGLSGIPSVAPSVVSAPTNTPTAPSLSVAPVAQPSVVAAPTPVVESPAVTAPTPIVESPVVTAPTPVTESPVVTAPTPVTESPGIIAPTPVAESPVVETPTPATGTPVVDNSGSSGGVPSASVNPPGLDTGTPNAPPFQNPPTDGVVDPNPQGNANGQGNGNGAPTFPDKPVP